MYMRARSGAVTTETFCFSDAALHGLFVNQRKFGKQRWFWRWLVAGQDVMHAKTDLFFSESEPIRSKLPRNGR